MDYIVIEGTSPWQGRYEFDLAESVDTFTIREWGWIKKLSGYLPVNVGEGLGGADAELIGTLAVIALERNGQIDKRNVPDTFERLIDSPYTAVRIEFGDVEEGDARPPETKPSENGTTSGPDSQTTSVTLPPTPQASGSPPSATSTSPRTPSAT